MNTNHMSDVEVTDLKYTTTSGPSDSEAGSTGDNFGGVTKTITPPVPGESHRTLIWFEITDVAGNVLDYTQDIRVAGFSVYDTDMVRNSTVRFCVEVIGIKDGGTIVHRMDDPTYHRVDGSSLNVGDPYAVTAICGLLNGGVYSWHIIAQDI